MKPLIVIISNPAARSSSAVKITRAIAYLHRRGFETELLLTERSNHAQELAQKALMKKPHRVIAAGGDGTINEVLNGMVGSSTPLAILPLGTSNVLANELSVPADVERAVERAISGKPESVSLGRIEASGTHDRAARYFILMAGVGFDAEAVLNADRTIKKISGEGSYVLSGISSLIRYRPEELLFTVDGKEHAGYAAIIGKASRYGGHFRVTPDADIRNPYFYLCIFRGKRRRDLIRYAAGVVFGRHLEQKDVLYLKASQISITGRAHIQIDGDYLGLTPATITVEQDALRLVC